jgi:hypothetical protein
MGVINKSYGAAKIRDDLSFKVAPLERVTLTHRVMIWIPMTANDRLDTRLPIGFATHPPWLVRYKKASILNSYSGSNWLFLSPRGASKSWI